MNFSYQPLGATGEVTGSKHLFNVGDKYLLLDCGMFQGRREDTHWRNKTLPFDAQDIDATILSHGHFDHCGDLSNMVKHGYSGNIYSTPATRDIANLILMDSAHIMSKDYEWLKNKRPNARAYEPIYEEGKNYFFSSS